MMEGSSPDVQVRIHGCLRELSDKVWQGERAQAMGTLSLEVAASVFCFWSDHPCDVIFVAR